MIQENEAKKQAYKKKCRLAVDRMLKERLEMDTFYDMNLWNDNMPYDLLREYKKVAIRLGRRNAVVEPCFFCYKHVIRLELERKRVVAACGNKECRRISGIFNI